MGDAAPSRARVAPKGRLQRRRPTYLTLRRKTGAREAPLYGNAARTLLPARNWRRRARLVRNPVGTPSSGARFSPECAPPQPRRTRPSLRRHFLAGGALPYGIPSGARLPASLPRRRGTFIRNPVGSPPPGVIFSPEAHFRAGHNDVGTKPSSGAFSPEAQSPPPSPPHTRLECQMLPASARTSARANALARGRHQAPPANTGSLEAT